MWTLVPIAAAVLAVLAPVGARAGGVAPPETYWIGNSGSWDDPTHWDNGVPGSGYDAFLAVSGATTNFNVTLDPSLNSLSIDGGATLAQGANTLTSNALVVGGTGAGTVDQSGGTQTTNQLFIGSGGGTGTYHLSGTGILDVTGPGDGVTYVGEGGTADFTQSGTSQFTTNYLNVGVIDGSAAHYDLSGGAVTVNSNMGVGSDGDATFAQTGGTVGVGGTLTVDGKAIGGTSGNYTLSGDPLTSTLTTNGLTVGSGGSGTFSQAGGTVNVNTANTMHVGELGGASGTYALSGGVLNVTTNEQKIGAAGQGYVNQTGGTHNFVNTAMYLGDQQGSYGEYNLSAGVVNGGSIALGEWGGQGKFIQTGGSVTVNELSLARQSIPVLSQGTYELSNGGLTVNGNERVGIQGVGIFEQFSGTNTVTGNLSLAEALGSTGTYTLSSGSLTVHGPDDGGAGTGVVSVGDAGVGHFTQNGGTVAAAWMDVGIQANPTASDYQQAGGSNTVTYNLVLGRDAEAKGTYALQGDASLQAGELVVGAFGAGTFTQNGTASQNQVDSVLLGYNTGGSGDYRLVAGTLTSDWDRIGMGGTGVFTQTGGIHTVGTTVVVGQDAGGDGSYHLDDGQLNAGWETVGRYNGSTGLFDQTGGNNTVVNDLNVGGQGGATGQGAYSLSGGDLTVKGSTYIGNLGSGTFTHSGGTQAVSNDLVLGNESTGHGTYDLSDTGSLAVTGLISVGAQGQGDFTLSGVPAVAVTAGGMTIGDSGIGTLTQDGGTLDITNELRVGHNEGGQGTFTQTGGAVTAAGGVLGVFGPTSKGTYNLAGGTLTTTTGLVVGYEGQGIFTQTGGTVDFDGNLHLGEKAGSSGTYTLSGAASILRVRGANEIVGVNGGTGQFTQSEGTHTVDTRLTVGGAEGATGRYDLTGGSLDSAVTVVGSSSATAGGTGVFNNSGGAHRLSRLGLGAGPLVGPGGNGTYNLSGTGSLQAADRIAVGAVPGGVGVFNQTGGTNTVATSVNVAEAVGSTGTYNLSGGSLTAADLNVNGGGAFNWTGGTLTLGTAGSGTLTNAGRVNVGGGVSAIPVTHALNAKLVNTGQVEVAADTILSSAGQIINTGNFNVKASAKLDGGGSFTQSDGLLTADGVLAQTGGFNLTGGTLNGTGTINGNVIVAGALVAPGHSPGTLTVNGDFTFNSGMLEIEIGGTSAGEYDLLDIGGSADFTGGTILFAFINGFLPTKDDTWTFLKYASLLSFNPTSVQYTGLASGFSYSVSSVGGSFVITADSDGQAEVPAPGTWLLLGAGLWGWRRVRGRAAPAA
ncbi:hypothetical protein THSYN_21090 [Candidatus Thiodictyon syntrophicum]|uniref:PEP-CTERM protein-sorting domain-containing protein n=1 Tax=Candidatus Thiodictyon syntrophicum TaxID=1166950 RepID=A0A2K8UDL9_9GAMM|nr:hypothetical protein THSYN_21090 [Candidatus Thiodictyon syntrophicum]